jgi:hypothetical protein
MSEHKHAAVLRAIADGTPLVDIEYRHSLWNEKEWSHNSVSALTNFILNEQHNERYEFRVRKKTHVVNGFTVPEPLREMPELQSEYFVESAFDRLYYVSWGCCNDPADDRTFKRGIAHATKEGAIANCKARLGIDPYKDES